MKDRVFFAVFPAMFTLLCYAMIHRLPLGEANAGMYIALWILTCSGLLWTLMQAARAFRRHWLPVASFVVAIAGVVTMKEANDATWPLFAVAMLATIEGVLIPIFKPQEHGDAS